MTIREFEAWRQEMERLAAVWRARRVETDTASAALRTASKAEDEAFDAFRVHHRIAYDAYGELREPLTYDYDSKKASP